MKFGDSPKVLVALAALILISASCGGEAEPLSQREISEVLIADGLDKDVADCIAGIEIRSGNYGDEATKQRVAELAASCQEAQQALADAESSNSDEENPNELAFSEPNDFGDDEILDSLWFDCESGKGSSCDESFSKSPIGSEYEKDGLSCGERPDILHCTELDLEDTGQPIPEEALQLDADSGEQIN